MLRRPAEKILINSLTDKTVLVDGSSVYIEGVKFDLATAGCIKYCAAPCQEKVVTVTVALPGTPCGCVEEWALNLKHKSRGLYDTRDIRPRNRVYTYDTPPNHTPTNEEIAAFIVASIQADKESEVEVIYTAATDTFQIKGKGCRNFDVYLPTGMGSVAENDAFIPAVLTADDMSRLFPIGHGTFGSTPKLPFCGVYCKYVLKNVGTAQDLAHSIGYIDTVHDLEFYVNTSDPNYAAYWEDKLAAVGCADDNCEAIAIATAVADVSAQTLVLTYTNGVAGAVVTAAIESGVGQVQDVTASDGTGATIQLEGIDIDTVVVYTVAFPGCAPISGTATTQA